MGERSETQTKGDDAYDDGYDPVLSDLMDEGFEEPIELLPLAGHQVSLATKRRKAEQRLEALRLREELGDYDFDFDDDF